VIDAYYLHSPGGNAYVALSRYEENVSIFVPQDQTKDLGEPAAQMARAKDKQRHRSKRPCPRKAAKAVKSA
jgi:hypothetical protein